MLLWSTQPGHRCQNQEKRLWLPSEGQEWDGVYPLALQWRIYDQLDKQRNLETFKNYPQLGLMLTDSDLIGLGSVLDTGNFQAPWDSNVMWRLRTAALGNNLEPFPVWHCQGISYKHLTFNMHDISPDLFSLLGLLAKLSRQLHHPSGGPWPKLDVILASFLLLCSFNHQVLMILHPRYCLNLFTAVPTWARTFHSYTPLVLSPFFS